jgi:hypothetical protein
VIKPWQERVELNWSRSGSYILGWLIFSSAWWWIIYTVEMIFLSSEIKPIDTYPAGLYLPTLALITIQTINFIFIGKE